MIRTVIQWVKRHRWVTACALLAFVVTGVNGMAWMHAWSMTHFVEDGRRPEKPEELSVAGKLKVLLTGLRIPKPVNVDQPETYGLRADVHRFATMSDEQPTLQLEAWHIPCDESRGLCILFHGYASSRSRLLPEAQAMGQMGFETLLVDFRGSGGSDGHVSTIGYAEAGDVAAAVKYARGTLTNDPIILYGQSMGAAAVMRAVAAERVEAQALILECPFDRLLSTTSNRFHAMGLPSFPLAEILVFWGGQQHGFSGFEHNPIDYAAAISCPVLLMNGQEDDRVTPGQAAGICDQFTGRNEFVVFPHTGHEACFQANDELWVETVESFLTNTLRESFP